MKRIHTPEQILEIYDKMELSKDLKKLKGKYNLPILARIIDQIDHEVRIELEKYNEFIGKEAKTNTNEFVIIDEFVPCGKVMIVLVHTCDSRHMIHMRLLRHLELV